MKIHYFDFVASGGVHTTFNSAMIEVLNKVYPQNEEIILYSERMHGEIVKGKCSSAITLKNLRFLFSKVVRFSKVRDLFSILFLLPKIIFASKGDILFVGLCFPFTIRFINFFSQIFRRPIFVTLHGEMQYFLDCDKRYIQVQHKKYFTSTRKCFARKNKYVHYVILGEPIWKNISFLFNKENKVIVINHPAIFSEVNSKKIKEDNDTLTIGMIGGGLERKGVESLFEIAGLLKDEIESKKLVLKICGFYSGENKNKVLVSYSNHVLSENELKEEIESLDYSLQLTTDKICKAIASGTFIDSLIFGKPIIGLHSSYLDFYCLDNYFVLSSEKEIAEKIKKILNDGKRNFYENDLNETFKIRKQFSIEYNTELFLKQLWSEK